VATFLLFLCIAAGCGVLGILFMLYGPTSGSVLRVRAALPSVGISFAPPRFDAPRVDAPAGSPARFDAPGGFDAFAPARVDGFAGSAPAPFVPIAHSLSTDFSSEERVQEVRIRAKSPSPPPLPPVTPLPPPPTPTKAVDPWLAAATPPPLPKAAQTIAPAPMSMKAAMPKAAQTIAPAAPLRAEATPTTPPRLGVSAPSARARHLEPPRRMPAPLPRSRSARGSDAPPVPRFATDNQRTVPRELEDFSTAEHTFVD
jgi:hypothetical protein